MNLGLNFGNPGILSGPRYLTQAKALFARMTVPPSSARKSLINKTIKSLLDAGVWQKLDALYVIAAHDAQAARLNWVQNAYNLSPVSSPTFTVDRGYTGNGTSSYLTTSYVPSTAAGNFTQNSATFATWTRSAAFPSAAGALGGNLGTFIYRGTSGGNNVITGVAGTSSGSTYTESGSSTGLFSISRTGSTNTSFYVNGVFKASNADASAALEAYQILFLARNNSGSIIQYYAAELAAGAIAGGLNGTQQTSLSAALSTYMTAVGAA